MSSYQTTGGPAFPFVKADFEYESGMTLRDYFAAQAMAPFINVDHCQTTLGEAPTFVAEWAYALADAMLEARKR